MKRLSAAETRRRRLNMLKWKIDWAESQMKELPNRIQQYRNEIDELVQAEKNDKKILEAQPQTKLEEGETS